MGARGGPLWQRITYHLAPPLHQGSGCTQETGRLAVEDAHGRTTTNQLTASFWDFLEQQMQLYQCRLGSCSGLPFDFCGGFVGYLGYELKAETCGNNTFQSPYPDAILFLVDR